MQSPPVWPVKALAMRQARSFASLPELTKVTEVRPSEASSASRSAYSIDWSVM